MSGMAPDCSSIPIVQRQEIKMIGDWVSKDDIEFLFIGLLSEILNSNFQLYNVQPQKHDLILTHHKSHVTPLQKYPPFIVVGLVIIISV